MKTGFDLLRNSALAMMFALGTVGLSACGDEGGDAPAPSEPAGMDDSYGDDSREKADEMMDDAGEAVDDAGDAIEDAAEDAKDSMDDAADDVSDTMKEGVDKTKDKMNNY